MNNLPEKLFPIRDQVIDHVLKNSPLPTALPELIEWYEGDGWDVLVPTWAEEEYVALNLACTLDLSDRALLEEQDEEQEAPISNEQRIQYARKLISLTFENYDGCDCPSVQVVDLQKPNGESAVMGWLIEIHGQGGPVPIYQGAFKDKSQFFQVLRMQDYLLDFEEHKLSDETILKLWK